MLAWNRLRLDPGDGSPLQDYRIENGYVEARVLDIKMKFEPERQCHWHRLTPPQLASHVMGNTVVAQWLQRRMGVHPLIRACAQSGHQVDHRPKPEPRALKPPLTHALTLLRPPSWTSSARSSI